MASKQVEKIADVVKKLREQIADTAATYPEEGVSEEDAQKILIDVYKEVANDRGKTVDTIRDACTRRLLDENGKEFKAKTFFDLVLKGILHDPNSGKPNPLIQTVRNNQTKYDNDAEIEKIFNDILR